MREVRRARAGAALVLTLAVAMTGLTACDDETPDPAPPPRPTSTPLEKFTTDGVSVARAQFCARVAPAAVERALGAAPTDTQSYDNGDRATLVPGVRDIAHEFGCDWTAADGSEARAWVFAPPVTPGRARALRSAALHERGCGKVRGAADFGSVSGAVSCRSARRRVTTYHGLFGDAWLSCSVRARGSERELLDRTGRWCVTVVQAAAA